MAEQPESKRGLFRRLRERLRGQSERAQGIQRRSKQERAEDFERHKRSSGSSGGVGGSGMPGGI